MINVIISLGALSWISYLILNKSSSSQLYPSSIQVSIISTSEISESSLFSFPTLLNFPPRYFLILPLVVCIVSSTLLIASLSALMAIFLSISESPSQSLKNDSMMSNASSLLYLLFMCLDIVSGLIKVRQKSHSQCWISLYIQIRRRGSYLFLQVRFKSIHLYLVLHIVVKESLLQIFVLS